MVYVNRNRSISIFLTRFYVIAILFVIPYIMGVVHFIQLNNTYILHFTVVPNVCSLWFVIIVFEYYFNICLTFQIFKTIVLLRKDRNGTISININHMMSIYLYAIYLNKKYVDIKFYYTSYVTFFFFICFENLPLGIPSTHTYIPSMCVGHE
jgi:hypothetical protein